MSFVTIPTAGAAAGTSEAGAVCGSSTRGDFVFGTPSAVRGPTEGPDLPSVRAPPDCGCFAATFPKMPSMSSSDFRLAAAKLASVTP